MASGRRVAAQAFGNKTGVVAAAYTQAFGLCSGQMGKVTDPRIVSYGAILGFFIELTAPLWMEQRFDSARRTDKSTQRR